MPRTLIFLLTIALVAAIGGAVGAQGIAEAHYFTFDNETPGIIAQGTTYTTVSPERFDYFADRVVSYAPLMDGLEITAAPASAPQGGNIMETVSGANDEGYWVEMTAGFPVGDVTVEAMFYTTNPNNGATINGTVYAIQSVVACYIPGGEVFQGQLRIQGNGAQNGNPGNTDGILVWNTEQPDGLPEVRVHSLSPLTANTWYHAVGVFDYNDSDPANSTIELLLAPAGSPPVSQGTTTYDADAGSGITVGWAPMSDPVQGPDATAGDPDGDPSDDKNRYLIGCSASNAINGSDHRGLDGGIDCVAVTAQAGQIYLPDAPPPPPVTTVGGWALYR